MKKPKNVNALEDFGRIRLSKTFFMRDFLFSDIAAIHGFDNLPDNPEIAIKAGEKLCQELLEPIQDVFGRISIRSAYRSPQVNQFGNENGHRCASNEKNFGRHIWDIPNAEGNIGATACIIVPKFYDAFPNEGDWQMLAWWIHDNLDYSAMYFFPKFWAFNLTWSPKPLRQIDSYVAPNGNLTRSDKENWHGNHKENWQKIIDKFPKAENFKV
jgi:hypothetical protein